MGWLDSLKSLGMAAAFCMAATAAQAITFMVDETKSSVTLTKSGALCGLANCEVSADLAAGLAGTTFDLDGVGASHSFDFLTFTGAGSGLVSYDISATLAFDPPSTSVTSGGSAGALLFFGSIVGGILTWDEVPSLITLADGSEVMVDFQGGVGVFLSNAVTTSASVTLVKVASAPLPASALMLLLGLTGLAGIGLARKKVA